MYGCLTALPRVKTLAAGLRQLKRGWATLCLPLAMLALGGSQVAAQTVQPQEVAPGVWMVQGVSALGSSAGGAGGGITMGGADAGDGTGAPSPDDTGAGDAADGGVDGAAPSGPDERERQTLTAGGGQRRRRTCRRPSLHNQQPLRIDCWLTTTTHCSDWSASRWPASAPAPECFAV